MRRLMLICRRLSPVLHKFVFLPLLAGLALLAACQKEVPVSEVKPLDLTTAARINGEAIYISDVELEAVAKGIVRPGAPFGPDHAEYAKVLDALIDQKLLAQEARARKLEAGPAAARRLELARERILGNLLVEDIVAREVTESAIDKMYAEQVELLQSNDEVSIAHILVETEAEAQAAAKRLRQGVSFEALAAEVSKDTATRMEGGDLGYVSPNEEPAPFPDVIAGLGVNQVSKPFKSDLGWHLLKVKDRRDKQPKSREDMRPEIVSFLTLNEVSDLLRKLRTQAVIQDGGELQADAARPDSEPAPPAEAPSEPAGPRKDEL
jgi:peptidyl-prolyl cis-trans isomerase C